MVSYVGNPETVTDTLSPAWGTLTPSPNETLPPGLTESEWLATVRVGATGVVVVPDPPVLPDDVPPVGVVTVVPPDGVPDGEVLPEDVLPVAADPVVSV